MAGAVVTYALLELVVGGRQRRRAKERDLIVQFGSTVKDVAVAASEELRRYGWLYDGSLAGAKLENASLAGADLFRANLGEADFFMTDLFRANLCAADVREANLSGANLSGTNLGGADLFGANLCQANLREALVTSEQLTQVKSLEGAIMPDGIRHG